VAKFGECCSRLAESLPHWDDAYQAEFQSVMSEDAQGTLTMQIGHLVLSQGTVFAGAPLSEERTIVVTDQVLFCPFCGTRLQEEADVA
jgi:hypothetical protein